MIIADCIPDTLPHAFTIGTFDGVHLGHQALLQTLKATGHPTAVLTFAAHPLKTLTPETAPLLITPLSLKLILLKAQGVRLTIALPFSIKFAKLSFDELLKSLPVSHLILGEGASFGRDREGTEENVKAWGQKNNIPVEYLSKTIPVSSQKIRDAIKSGHLLLAEQLLGRAHLLYVPAYTAKMSVSGLVMPPDGAYLLSYYSCTKASRSRSKEKIMVTLHSGWAHFPSSFVEPTILAFNPRESHVL